MFDAVKRLLGGKSEPKPDTVVDPHEAAVALMVEAALADGIYANLESDMIAEILIESFGFSADRTDHLMHRGELLAEEAIGAHQFTKEVKALAETERVAVIEGLYRVALADGDKCKFEDAYIRHVASLLHVDDISRAGARQRAEARVQGD
ncbi:MAG: TerB family tellurite resistance protein [Pseudomonadota bacterium]